MSYTIDHVALGVEDVTESTDWYETHLGYTVEDETTRDGTTSVFMSPSDVPSDGAGIELREVGTDPSIGDAWGHIAVRVQDLEGSYEELMTGGVPDYRDPESCGGRYAFVKDPDGHEIELVTRDSGARWSIDHVMMRVEDADAAIGFWTRKFEYEHVGRWEADTFANFFMRPPEASEDALAVELTYNYDGRSYTFGDAWDHVGIEVDDLETRWEEMRLRDAAIERTPSDSDGIDGVVHDPDGHRIQLFE